MKATLEAHCTPGPSRVMWQPFMQGTLPRWASESFTYSNVGLKKPVMSAPSFSGNNRFVWAGEDMVGATNLTADVYVSAGHL